MKKLFSLVFMAFLAVALVSCAEERYQTQVIEHVVDDSSSVVYDIKNVNFSYNSSTGYFIERKLNILNSDVILIYRKVGNMTDGTGIWQQIPRTIYVNAVDELDYDFDFSNQDLMIYAGGNYDLSTTPEYIYNQTFRVVIVPGNFGNKNPNLDISNYYSVIKYYNINDKNVKEL